MRRGLVAWFWGCFLFFISGEVSGGIFETAMLAGLKPSAYIGAPTSEGLRVPDYYVLAMGEV
jgi:hypothetical protein